MNIHSRRKGQKDGRIRPPLTDDRGSDSPPQHNRRVRQQIVVQRSDFQRTRKFLRISGGVQTEKSSRENHAQRRKSRLFIPEEPELAMREAIQGATQIPAAHQIGKADGEKNRVLRGKKNRSQSHSKPGRLRPIITAVLRSQRAISDSPVPWSSCKH